MSKITFNKDEIRNISEMLNSSDEENHMVALSGLQTVDIKKNIGELIVLFKYGSASNKIWKEACPIIFEKLYKIMGDHKSGSQTLSLMDENKCSKDSIELFLEFFVKDVKYFLKDMGYPMERFELDIKLK